MIAHRDFANYYNKYFQDLYNYGKNITVQDALIEDCIQETFLQFWQQRESAGTIKLIKAYLLASLRRIIFRKLKQQKRREIFNTDKEFALEGLVPDADPVSINQQKLKEHLQHLSKRQREALYLLYYDNLDYEETAFVMGLETKSVYNLTYQGIQKLKSTMNPQDLFILSLILLLYFLPFQ